MNENAKNSVKRVYFSKFIIKKNLLSNTQTRTYISLFNFFVLLFSISFFALSRFLSQYFTFLDSLTLQLG
jgi:hypothetical protein